MSEVIVKQGVMDKEGGGPITRWQTRMFILTRTELSWFKPEDLRQPLGKFQLGEVVDVKKQVGDRHGRSNLLTVNIGSRKAYQLAALSKEEQAEWITALHPSTQGSFAAKAIASSATTTAAVTPTAEADKVLEELKRAAKELTGMDTVDRRQSSFIPIVKEGDEGEATVMSPTTLEEAVLPASTAQEKSTGVKFAVVEVFISHGLRISGPVSNQMFTLLGQGVPNDKKKLDKRGWYCDRSYTLCSVIQAFITSGWVLYRISHSSSSTPWEPGQILPVNLAVFGRGGGVKPLCMSESESRQVTQQAAAAVRATQPKSVRSKSDSKASSIKAVEGLLPSEEAELRTLMEEFNIPLNLLDVHVQS